MILCNFKNIDKFATDREGEVILNLNPIYKCFEENSISIKMKITDKKTYTKNE